MPNPTNRRYPHPWLISTGTRIEDGERRWSTGNLDEEEYSDIKVYKRISYEQATADSVWLEPHCMECSDNGFEREFSDEGDCWGYCVDYPHCKCTSIAYEPIDSEYFTR